MGDVLTRHQYVKTLPHAGGSDQMFELQSDLGALLWPAAFFEGIRELILLADSHQKLRLREQRLRLHAILPSRVSKRCKVDVCGEVLLSRRFVGSGAHRMFAKSDDCAPMTSGELLLARIAVVDCNDESALYGSRNA